MDIDDVPENQNEEEQQEEEQQEEEPSKEVITINKEDFEIANKYFHSNHTVYIPGIGIDLERFSHASVDKKTKRQEISAFHKPLQGSRLS